MKKSKSGMFARCVAVICVLGLSGWGTQAYAQTSNSTTSSAASKSHEVCRDVMVPDSQSSGGDEHNLAGTAIGAVAGGLAGHMFGKGKGRTLATIAGAAGGGYVGNRVQDSRKQNNSGQHVERRCTQE